MNDTVKFSPVSIGHTMKNGKQGTIVLNSGASVTTINKNKEGKLLVVSTTLDLLFFCFEVKHHCSLNHSP